MAPFPSPVLSVAADAVRDLDGREALSGLWKLFTRCKESLQDGQRLENISWRLWYREVAQIRTSKPPVADASTKFAPPVPLSPMSEDGTCTSALMPDHLPATHIPPQSVPYLNGRPDAHPSDNDQLPASPASSVHLSLFKSSASVGKIICDMIPDKLVVVTAKRPSISKLDVNDASRTAHPVEPCIVVAPMPSSTLPAMRLPSTPPSISALFPRVVVVNPTPHPTPPATPVPAVAQYPTFSNSQTHLVPPPRCPAPGRSDHTNSPAGRPATAVPASRGASMTPSENQNGNLDETLKPSDRRFFLQQEESPSPERDSHSQKSTGTSHTPSDAGDLEPSSATSNQTKDNTVSKHSTRGRKAKEAARHAPVRPSMQRHPTQRQNSLPQRKAAGTEAKRPSFNVGSASSTGSKATSAGASKSTNSVRDVGSGHPCAAPSEKDPPAPPQQQRRGIIVSHSSSEYETTDTDDDSWMSEEGSEQDEEQAKKKKEEVRIREAALEAQRQRDMFAKVPKRSYSNLNRTQSGLLSQLLNPDGAVPRSSSSIDISHQRRPSAGPVPLPTSKSSAALPSMAQITAEVPTTNGATKQRPSPQGYRPKGRPQEQELEDESDSEEENPDDTIQVPRSLAHQRLAALADPSRRRRSEHTQPSQPQMRPTLPTVATAPIPLNHPWNLPPPAPPMTPRTTRRQMLATELSESLRRNLLWERQVSKTNLVGNPRRPSGLLSNSLRPLTSTTSTSAATAEGVSSSRQPSEGEREGEREREKAGEKEEEKERKQAAEASTSANEGDERSDRKRKAMARNRSWADDYHYSGW